MRITLSVLSILALAGLALGSAADSAQQTWEAHVTDTMCGATHMMDGMSHPDCVIACQEMGASIALYVASEEKVFAIANPDEAQPFAGTDVTITGTVSDDGETITIQTIESR